jgi:carboxypeptidase Q
MKKRAVIILFVLCFGLAAAATENIDSGMNWKIRQEETDNSQVMRLVHQLADVYGPRLTGSPNFEAACNWAIEQMQQWGLKNEHLEKWDFGHPGWGNDGYSVRVLSPYRQLLEARVIAWTPGTNGVVKATIVQISPPDRPTVESLQMYLDSVKDRVCDRIVLVGPHVDVPIAFNPAVKRRDDSDLQSQFDPNKPPQQRQPEQQLNAAAKPLEPREVDEKVDAFLVANRALVKITDSAREHGQIRVFANRTYNASKAVPGLVLRNEDYGRICRVLADGKPIDMEIDIQNTIYPGQTSLNAIAEIPGTDNSGQVVMLGGHIDSWHGGVGATDNATGVAVMMEAVRILQKLGVKPRRTIRIALWGGEEQGLLGSKAYVEEHFGAFESPKKEFSGVSGYVNLDSGTGRVRGASVFGPPETAAIVRQILQPFADLGVAGVSPVQSRSHGGTDSSCFNWAGLPGINLSQDPIEYQTHTWHTNLDTYERVLEPDLKQCAIVAASVVYHLSMRDDPLPRFSKEAMPSPEK